jgi:hypothetical protein
MARVGTVAVDFIDDGPAACVAVVIVREISAKAAKAYESSDVSVVGLVIALGQCGIRCSPKT